MIETRREQLQRLVPPTLNAIIAHADELTELDQAIGDGDHGINMKRGAEKYCRTCRQFATNLPMRH